MRESARPERPTGLFQAFFLQAANGKPPRDRSNWNTSAICLPKIKAPWIWHSRLTGESKLENQRFTSSKSSEARLRIWQKGSVLKEELTRALWNPRWIFIAFIAGVIVVLGSYNWSPKAPHPVNWLMLQLYFGHYEMLAPFLAAIPFTDSFVNDRDKGFGRFILQRSLYKNYLRSKMIAVFVSGGLSLVLVLLVMLGINALAGGDWASRAFVSNNMRASIAGPFSSLYASDPLFYFGYLLVLSFFLGGGFALIGLALSVLVANRYLGIVAPVVITQLWSFLVQRTRHLTQSADPLESLMPWYGVYEGLESAMLPAQIAQVCVISFASILLFFLLTRNSRNRY